MRLAALLLAILPAFGQSPAAPVAPPASVVEPSQFFTTGAGISGLGPTQPFGYYSVSQRIADGTYTTEINEFARLKGGKVASCARAGVSKVLWRFGVFTIGAVGDAGACEGVTGSASGAIAERSFLSAKFGKTNFYFVSSAEGLKVAGSGQQTIITIGIGYGLRK